MPRSGTGTYTLPSGTDFSNGTTADGPEVQAAFNDVASALSGSLAADGQTPLAGNLNGGGYTITNVSVNGVDITLSGQYKTTNPGNVSSPAYALTDAGLGFYRYAANKIGVATGSSISAIFSDVGIDLIGGGVKYPATQVPSADANTLDDYEEGTWVPTGNGVTLTVNAAKYVKVGKLVTAWFDVTWPSTANASTAQIKTLPFTVDSAMVGACSIGYQTHSSLVQAVAQNNTTYIEMFQLGGSDYTNATLSTKRFIGTATYMASA